MLTTRALELVQTHRARIDLHIDRTIALLDHTPEEACYPLALSRWRMLQMLREYHLFKKVEIYDPAIRSGTVERARQAERMLQACRMGWIGYTSHTLEWSSRDIVAVWPVFTAAARGVANRLHDHLVLEEVLVRQLLEHSLHTRLHVA